MEEQENQVTQVTENTEHTAEETPVMYSQKQVDEIVNQRLNEIMPGKIARKAAKIRKETDREYEEIMGYLRAATGKETVGEITEYVRDHYGSRGVTPKAEPEYSAEDLAVLADADVKNITRGGYEEVVEEEQRLGALGDRMTPREKAVHTALTQHRQQEERTRELQKIGANPDVYQSSEFQAFAKKFQKDVPITEVYQHYTQAHPQKQIQTMGSVKSSAPEGTGVKEFYSFEEAKKFTRQDFDKNPALYAAVQKSMQNWK